MGGSWSLKLAVDQPKLAACVVNYGWLPSEPALVAKIKAPVQGNFGADDQGIPPKDVISIRSRDEDRRKSRGHQDL